MRHTLNLYQDTEGTQFIAIVYDQDKAKEWEKNLDLALVESVELDGTFSNWPTETLFSQDMFV